MILTRQKQKQRRPRRRPRTRNLKYAYTRFSSKVQYGPGLYQGYFAEQNAVDPFGQEDNPPKYGVKIEDPDIKEDADGVGYYTVGPGESYRRYFTQDPVGRALIAYRVDSECRPCAKDGKCYSVQSTLRIKFVVLIHPHKLKGRSLGGVYGHEQLHIKPMIKKYIELKETIARSFKSSWYHKRSKCYFKTLKHCEDELEEHKDDFRIKNRGKPNSSNTQTGLKHLMWQVLKAGSGHYRPWMKKGNKTNDALKGFPEVTKKTKHKGESGVEHDPVGDYIKKPGQAPVWNELPGWQLRHSSTQDE